MIDAKTRARVERSGLLAGVFAAAVFVWHRPAARRERARLETLIANRTRQLRQSEELFRSIFEHATEGIFQSSLDGRNLHANPAMAHLCGYADSAQMQRELTDVATQFYVQADRRREISDAVASDGAAVGWESEIRRRDGSTLWISESVRTVVEPASGRTVYQGSIMDITARRQMQAAHEQARLAAEAANAAKSVFLTHMTHELRTPLTGILSNARVALRDSSLDEKHRSRYALIATSGEHLLALIDEMLDLSRIEAGRMEIRSNPFVLDDLLGTVADVFRSRPAEKRLAFRCTVDPTLPRAVRGDPLRLRQVLDNLLGNAFKFTVRGNVTLNVRRGVAGVVRFEVEDTGIGIPADHLTGIFERFRQVGPADQRSYLPGTGLGLHISARLVELLGGKLCVQSVPGQGSRFFFDLPLPTVEPSETERLPPMVAGSASTVALFPRALPSAVEIEALLTLCLEGDIVRLRARIKALAAADDKFTEFVEELDGLAAGFRMSAIAELLEGLRPQVANDPPGCDPSSQAGST